MALADIIVWGSGLGLAQAIPDSIVHLCIRVIIFFFLWMLLLLFCFLFLIYNFSMNS